MGIEGKWFNELGSVMSIDTINGNSFTGQYQTQIGDAQGAYALTGQCDGDQGALGWAVGWINEHGDAQSATAWSGQYQIVGGEETISAMWLLTMDTASQDDWKSTLAGKDTFTRMPPHPDVVARASRGPAPHPG